MKKRKRKRKKKKEKGKDKISQLPPTKPYSASPALICQSLHGMEAPAAYPIKSPPNPQNYNKINTLILGHPPASNLSLCDPLIILKR